MPQILLIDDDDLFRSMLRATLEQLGHSVTEAEDGNKGVMRYAQSPFDLVITDLIMPEKEGVETIMELKKKWPGVKIIAMSGGGRAAAEGYLAIAKKLGAIAALEKPFSTDKLTSAITSLLSDPG